MKQENLPKNFGEELNKRLDFEWAYNALEGYEHYHSYTARGVMRMYQLRNEEAIECFDEAERRFESPESDELRYAYLLTQRATVRLVQEYEDLSESAAVRTDAEVERLRGLKSDVEAVRRLRGKTIGFHHIARGRFAEGLEQLEAVIAETTDPGYATLAYVGASAAAHELGLFKQSRRHYENAELCMAFLEHRADFCISVARLMGMSKHWGWDGEYNRWLSTLEALECPTVTRDLLFHRFELLYGRCKAGNSLVLA